MPDGARPARSMPSLSSSPLIRSVPESRFSRDMVMMRSRTSGLSCGRPPLERDFPRQNRRQPWRCQRTTVSGVTNVRCSRQPAHHRRASTQSSLSQVPSRARGRVRVDRVRTASWCRSSKFSSRRSWRGRTQARTVVSNSQRSSSTSSAAPICAHEVLPPDSTRHIDGPNGIHPG
jgi:hypothetical protein